MKTRITTFFVLFLSLIFMQEGFVLAKEIKIGLLTLQNQITIGSNTEADLVNLYNNQVICTVDSRKSYSVKRINDLISVLDNLINTKIGAFTGPLKLVPKTKAGLIFCNRRWYRGELLIIVSKDTNALTFINQIDLEDYLLSVVPSEIPSSWNKEALKAQAVAARSYTLGYLGRRKKKGYDLESTVEDQVYLGIISEKKSTSEVVKETKGQILINKNNEPLIALYHSSGGGYTDSVENLWDEKPISEIKPRPDYDDHSPHFQWYRDYKLSKVNESLASLNIGEIKNVIPLSRSISSRITWIKVIGASDDVLMRGEEFRKSLKLPSSKFNVEIENGVIKFAGRGFGHGLGLSQWGAKELAENSFTYDEILSYYYPGSKLVLSNYE